MIKKRKTITDEEKELFFLIAENYENYRYYAELLAKMPNEKFKIIQSVSEYCEDELEDSFGGIYISPKINPYELSHCLYDIETFKKVKNKMEAFLSDVPFIKEDKSNEFEVFELICKKCGKIKKIKL